MAERRDRNTLASGFGFGLGGCLGLLAIPVLGGFLLLKSCEQTRPATPAPGATPAPRADLPPAPTDISLATMLPERTGDAITVEVRALNKSTRWLITANVDCEVLVNGESVGISQRGVQQMAPDAAQTMKHRVEGATKTGPISVFCKVTKADFGPGKDRPNP